MRLEDCDTAQLEQLAHDERFGSPARERIAQLLERRRREHGRRATSLARQARHLVDMRPEREIRVEIKNWYRLRGAKVWDTEQERADPRVDAGLADLIVLWPGRRVRFVEVKSAKGRQRPAQAAFQVAAEAAGAVYLLPRSVQEVIEFEAANPS